MSAEADLSVDLGPAGSRCPHCRECNRLDPSVHRCPSHREQHRKRFYENLTREGA